MKSCIALVGLLISGPLCAQPDTLWVPSQGKLIPYAVDYGLVRPDPAYTRIGRFVSDTGQVAVELDYKRGTPSGIYRAYYPDGRPLIFAVYGWGSLHGDWTEYDESGAVSLKGKYEHGQRNGIWAFRQEGIVGHYRDGLKYGKWKYYENERLIRTEKYRKDELKRTNTFDTR